MKIKLDQKIIGYQVLSSSNDAVPPITPEPLGQAIELMTEHVSRPDELYGSTYKVKTPQSEHALYITINDIILNPGTDDEQRRPFEIFINSKNMEQFQWVVALTRVISAVFRKGGDCTFLAEELKAVFDPQGGYFKRGGKFMPSLVAEIGEAIEQHLTKIGMIKVAELGEHQKDILAEKRAVYDSRISSAENSGETDNAFPPSASLCQKCMTKATILMDGCMTCLNCGESKCG
ncbi:MAG: hypothetical protein ACI9LL_000619 [Porticoccus sp.]|jgi:hypothetical protein